MGKHQHHRNPGTRNACIVWRWRLTASQEEATLTAPTNRTARPWQSHDPNEPGLSDPCLAKNWNPVCNLDDSGASEYVIDLADFSLFCDEWLWAACWKLEQINEEMVMFGGESMMMTMPLSMDVMSLEMEPEPTVKTEPEISVDTLVEIIGFLDEFLAEQPENAENIEELRTDLVEKLKAVLEK